MPTQTIVVEKDRRDPNRVMVTVREQNGFGNSIRVKKDQLQQLITELENILLLWEK